jgi:hypothetical protein
VSLADPERAVTTFAFWVSHVGSTIRRLPQSLCYSVLGDELIADAPAIANEKSVAKIRVFRFRLSNRKPHRPEAVRTNRRVGGWRIGLVYLWHSTGSTRPNQAL